MPEISLPSPQPPESIPPTTPTPEGQIPLPESQHPSDEALGWQFDLLEGEGKDMEGVTKDEFLKMSPEMQDRVLGKPEK